jgi:hypothetical protein
LSINLEIRTGKRFGRAARPLASRSSDVAFLLALRILLERRLRMGTKPMVFPLDGSGRLYALYDENDEQICTGSRETCYRLLALMLRAKKPAPEMASHAAVAASAVDVREQAFQTAAAGGTLLK